MSATTTDGFQTPQSTSGTVACIFGPVVFGFHGLFLAPIVPVLALTFADTALIRLLGGDSDETGPDVPRGQRQLNEF